MWDMRDPWQPFTHPTTTTTELPTHPPSRINKEGKYIIYPQFKSNDNLGNIISLGYSENNLFFDERHAEYLLRPMSINVLDDSEDEEGSLSVSTCNGEWVELWGTFIKAVDTDVSYFKGRLVVDKAVLHKNGDTCWQRTKPSFLEQRK